MGLIIPELSTNALCMWWKEIIVEMRHSLKGEEENHLHLFINLIKSSRWLNVSIARIHNSLFLKIFQRMMSSQLCRLWMIVKRNWHGKSWQPICRDFYLREWWWWIRVSTAQRNKFLGKAVEDLEDKMQRNRVLRLLLLGV